MLRAMILEELAVSQGIVRKGHEVVPRFRVLAPDGEHTIMVQLPDDLAARSDRMGVVRAFMIWKAATGFVHASELIEPDAIAVLAVTRDDVAGCLQCIRRRPLSFTEPEWFGRESVGEDLMALLPPRATTLDARELDFIERAFEDESVPGIKWARAAD